MKKIKFGEVDYIDFVEDGAIASSHLGIGKLIPCLVLDIGQNSDLSLLFKSIKPGTVVDSKVQWGQPLFGNDIIFLKISYEQPIEVEFHIRFFVVKHGILVDMIMANKALMLFEGSPGEKVSNKLSNGDANIIVEVPQLNYFKTWNRIWEKNLLKKFRDKGFSKSEAKKLTHSTIEEIRKFKKVQVT